MIRDQHVIPGGGVFEDAISNCLILSSIVYPCSATSCAILGRELKITGAEEGSEPLTIQSASGDTVVIPEGAPS